MDLSSRLKKVRDILHKENLDAFFISSHAQIMYLTNYLGFIAGERDAFLFITHKNTFLITHDLYFDDVSNLKNFTVLKRDATTPLLKILTTIAQDEGIKNVGFEADDLHVNEYVKLSEEKTFHFVSSSIAPIRIQKDPYEIEQISLACTVAERAFTSTLPLIKEHMTEKELSYFFEMEVKKQFADFSFDMVVAFGKNSAVPHHKPDETKLKKTDVILLDFGVKQNGYCSDISRTIFFGKPTDEMRNAYTAVLQTLDQTLILMEKEKDMKTIDAFARKYITDKNFPEFPHALGHGIGLEVHESPIFSPYTKDTLVSNMTLAVEPATYLSGKFGIRIEDDVLMTSKGAQLLTTSPKEIIVL
ncbi:MAG TPA: Xaa-Pro peptidase family protein [Patescibacteria group bacterium]|nr:Xaa-Pro peptidase family protein [Patescibacteria group bacterium]